MSRNTASILGVFILYMFRPLFLCHHQVTSKNKEMNKEIKFN